MAPIELPVRTRNWAIERLALVTIGFWPVMVVRSPSGGIERLGIGQGLAQADVDDDLASLRHLVGVAVFELLLERGHDLGRVALVEAAGHDFTSSCSPQWRQTRTRRPLSSVAWAIRVGLPQLVQTTMTLPIGIGWAISRMPPCWILGMRSVVLGRLARLGVALGDVQALDDDAHATGRRAAPEHAPAAARRGAGVG